MDDELPQMTMSQQHAKYCQITRGMRCCRVDLCDPQKKGARQSPVPGIK